MVHEAGALHEQFATVLCCCHTARVLGANPTIWKAHRAGSSSVTSEMSQSPTVRTCKPSSMWFVLGFCAPGDGLLEWG
jgi:hypothetical protein